MFEAIELADNDSSAPATAQLWVTIGNVELSHEMTR